MSPAVVLLLLCCLLNSTAESGPAKNHVVDAAQKLAAKQRWQDLVALLEPISTRSVDMDFYLGTALARLGRWAEAERTFEAGRRLAPDDVRFPIELAGTAFKLRRYVHAAHLMREAARFDPHDAYTNDFLGTIYFLQGNLEASLKYWNRVGKPELTEIRQEPLPEVSPELLDRAFAFAPASTLKLNELLDTNTRIRGLGIFPQYQLDLRAKKDGRFDVVFRNQERDGFGHTRLDGLFQLLRGLPFSSINPGYFNLHHEAINLVSMYRWDAQKRRVFADISGPFERSAKVRFELIADLRDEEWAIRSSFAGPAPVLASLNMRREQLGFEFASHANGRWSWSGGAEISHRDFRNVDAGTVLTPELLLKGYQLKQRAQLGATIWRVPERRFTLIADVSSETARLWSQQEESWEKLGGEVNARWFPLAKGDDYEMHQRVRAGKTIGQVPFDELFMLGLERDNDLPMRGHIGTRDGRKGSAPLGRDYFLGNWEADKSVYGNGFVSVRLGPFFDTGKITDSSMGPGITPGSHKWLSDIGAQVKLRVFGSGVAFTYGKDLRSGNNAFYVTILTGGEGYE